MPSKDKPKAERAKEMPLTDEQAEKAIQSLRNDAGSAAYRKRLSSKKKSESKAKGGKLRGYGMARGGKACKMR